ncbi:MAG TPA: histidine--tRNA ligase [Nitrososphaerales archaeon]|nr:histidine--tRNA ligase [Nitrososphaerales archaeon]
MDYTLPRGMRDIPPEEAESAEVVRSSFIDTCKLFGYRLMEPSTLELMETLEAKSGPGIRDEIYYFNDKSGRELGLRFDLTVGITRYVTSRRDLTPPVRVASYSSMWRYDEPQYGRYRWFYQWDAELFGPSNSEADAEIIEFTSALFKKLGLRARILLGSRKLVESFIRQELKIEEEGRILDALRAIDKLGKKSIEQIASEYSRSITAQDLQKLAEFVKLKGGSKDVSSSLSEMKLEATPLLEIIDSLSSRGISDVELNLGVVRGIDYYTDMVFEAIDGDKPKLGSLCGGGRYDSLPAVYGRPELGATGVAGGVERALLSLELSRLAEANKKRVFVAPIGTDIDMLRKAASIASDLRRNGIAAQSEISGRSLRKILEAQSEAGTSAVVIVGRKELAEDSVKIKWMKSGEEVTVKISDLADALK